MNKDDEEPGPVDGSGLLYHYTSQQGFLGIVQTRSVWATDVSYFNDSSEFEFTCSVAEDELVGLLGKDRSPEGRKALGELMAAVDMTRDMARVAGPYVFALCPRGDQLSQWRGYAPNGGYSLGFELDVPGPAGDSGSVELIRCSYDKADLRRQLRKAIKDLLRRPMDLNWPFPERFRDLINRLAVTHKHPGFMEEGEYRLVLRDFPARESVRFRPGTHTLIPYYPFRFRGGDHHYLRLRHVFVGPTAHPQLALTATERYLNRPGFIGDYVS